MEARGKCVGIGQKQKGWFTLPTDEAMQTPVRIQLNTSEKEAPIYLKFRFPAPANNWYKETVAGIDWSPLTFPRTLSEFKQWWEALNSGFLIYVPTTVSDSWKISDPLDDLSSIPMPSKGTIAPATLFPKEYASKNIPVVDLYIERKSEQSEEFIFQCGLLQTIRKPLKAAIPITSLNKCTVSQTEISGAYLNVHTGSFERGFADLAAAARDRADLSLEEIKTLVHEEAAKGTEVFEAFGMKFPAGQITFWGTVILLSIQLYFFVYLKQLFGKLKSSDAGWNVPWIAMDSSRISKAVFYFTVVIVPPLAAILLDWQAAVTVSSGYWEKTQHWFPPIHFLVLPWHWHYTVTLRVLLLIVAAIASGYLSRLSWKFRPQVIPETEMPSCPARYFE
jgi:hypothetical protein